MRNVLPLAVALMFCGSGLSLEAEPEGSILGEWKLISTSDGVAIYRRSRPGPGHYESKAIGEIAAATSVVQAVIDDVNAYSQFMPYTVESRILKRDGDSVVGYQRISTPLVKDRDYTLRVRRTSKPVEGGISYTNRWETENELGPAERPGIVRVKLCEGSWLLEPAGPNVTRATYTIHTDSGGPIPAFIKNVGSQVGIRKIFIALRNQVKDPKYHRGVRQ